MKLLLLLSFQTYLTKLVHDDAGRQIEKVKQTSENLNEEYVEDRVMEIESKCVSNWL